GVQAQLPAPSQFVEVEPGSVVVRRSSALESQRNVESSAERTRLDQPYFSIGRSDTRFDVSLDTADLEVTVTHLTVSQSTQTLPAGGVVVRVAEVVECATQIVTSVAHSECQTTSEMTMLEAAVEPTQKSLNEAGAYAGVARDMAAGATVEVSSTAVMTAVPVEEESRKRRDIGQNEAYWRDK
uniref:TMEM132 domain-containing protein n=1 Tax=Mesocestoides corti TaxID=53468 RepID=A0A5K3G2B1_MESCO